MCPSWVFLVPTLRLPAAVVRYKVQAQALGPKARAHPSTSRPTGRDRDSPPWHANGPRKKSEVGSENAVTSSGRSSAAGHWTFAQVEETTMKRQHAAVKSRLVKGYRASELDRWLFIFSENILS